MSKKLANKIAVVTGGSAGIGLGAAKRFAEEGAQVFIIGRGSRSWTRRSPRSGETSAPSRAMPRSPPASIGSTP
jgi:NAD(P)-dependent dehydrogenase (short-subunit alcohol dehydrogenase family)